MSAEAIGAQVIKILGLMTPRKVSDLVAYKKDEELMSLNGLSIDVDSNNDGPVDHRAKVIPINKDDQEEEQRKEVNQNEPEDSPAFRQLEEEIRELQDSVKESKKKIQDGGGNVEHIGIRSAREEQELQEKLAQLEKMKEPSTSVFLIEQKEKSKKSQESLKKMEVYGLYSKSIKVDIRKPGEESSKPLENKGILINKKHS